MLIHLVRHAVAQSRRAWNEPDEVRPLDERGGAQARALVTLRDWTPVHRIMSSPAVRCVETVAPLSAALGIRTETEQLLAEGGDPAKVVKLMLAHDDSDLVLCSHGDVIPEVLRLVELRGGEIARPRKCAKGSTWTVEVSDATFLGATYAPPLA